MKSKKYYKIPSNLWSKDKFDKHFINDLKRTGEIVNLFKDDSGYYTYEILFNWGNHNIRDKDLKLQQLIGFGDPVYE